MPYLSPGPSDFVRFNPAPSPQKRIKFFDFVVARKSIISFKA